MKTTKDYNKSKWLSLSSDRIKSDRQKFLTTMNDAHKIKEAD